MAESALTVSLDRPTDGDRRLAVDPCEDINRRIDADTVWQLLEVALTALPDRERLVLTLRFGLFGERQHTLAELAAMQQMTPDGIRKTECRALWRLCQRLTGPARKLGLAIEPSTLRYYAQAGGRSTR